MDDPTLPTARARAYSETWSYANVYHLAARLAKEKSSGDPPLCLVSDDRPIACAAVLSAMTGGPRLVIPHSLSPGVLEDARQATGFDRAIGPSDLVLPAGVARIVPEQPGGEASPPALFLPGATPVLSLFTGGSTGRPQVWSKTIDNLMGESRLLAKVFAISEDDVFVSSVPPLHIYGLLFSVLLPLTVGARVIDRPAYLPAEIASLLLEARPSVFVSGPTHYRALRETSLTAPGLRLAFSSGGMLDAADGAHFFASTGIGVIEVYGSTETGGIAYRQRHQSEIDWTPFEGVRWKVSNERLQVASGWLSPELERDSDGLFTTGDRVEPTTTGRFTLLGRADGIVKVAGKRVDLLEVEQKLRAIEGVADAHVVAETTGGSRGAEIVALFVSSLPDAEVREGLQRSLQPQAMPRRLIRVDHIPTTPAGKRDRKEIERLVHDAGPSSAT